MPPPAFKLTEVAHLRGDRELHVHGELDFATAPALRDRLRSLSRLGHPVAVDLSQVSFMDSSGLSLLLDLRRAAARDGWEFAVLRPSPPVLRVIALARAEDLLAAGEPGRA